MLRWMILGAVVVAVGKWAWGSDETSYSGLRGQLQAEYRALGALCSQQRS